MLANGRETDVYTVSNVTDRQRTLGAGLVRKRERASDRPRGLRFYRVAILRIFYFMKL